MCLYERLWAHLRHSKAWRSEHVFQELVAFYLVGAGSLVSAAVVHTPVQFHSVLLTPHPVLLSACCDYRCTTGIPLFKKYLLLFDWFCCFV